jgi:dihydrofolate reductase
VSRRLYDIILVNEKLIFAINITLDSCCDHTKLVADEELHEYHTQLLREVDVLVYGRKTYELMVPFWPDVAKNQSGQASASTNLLEP